MTARNIPCPFCGHTLEITGYVGRKETCPGCGRDLHCCEACSFHDPAAHNQCREPKAEFQARRDRSNYCDLFELSAAGPAAGADADKESARKRQLDDLFKNF